MKLITFAVPCYNSACYMDKCIKSLLVGGERVEIILIDDGSMDDETPEICDSYAKRYPNIIRVIHQENGGHGEGINQGLKYAKGLYFKVVDSDDWLNETALIKVLKLLGNYIEIPLDLLITNYVYEHLQTKTQRVCSYENVFPTNETFDWLEVGRFKLSQYILMHSVIYCTSILRESTIKLPKHTFYVDNIFVFLPLLLTKNLYYMDVDLYRYFIGRDDQSVNEQVMIRRIDQQIRVTKIMIDGYNQKQFCEVNPKLMKYMSNYLSMMVSISSIFLTKEGTVESLNKKKELWNYLHSSNKSLYTRFKYQEISAFTALPGKIGRIITLAGYNIAKKIYKFN